MAFLWEETMQRVHLGRGEVGEHVEGDHVPPLWGPTNSDREERARRAREAYGAGDIGAGPEVAEGAAGPQTWGSGAPSAQTEPVTAAVAPEPLRPDMVAQAPARPAAVPVAAAPVRTAPAPAAPAQAAPAQAAPAQAGPPPDLSGARLTFNHPVPAGLTPEAVRARMLALGEYLQNAHGISATLNGDVARISGKISGVTVDGIMTISGGNLSVNMKDPGFLFRSAARSNIQDTLTQYLNPATKVEDLPRR